MSWPDGRSATIRHRCSTRFTDKLPFEVRRPPYGGPGRPKNVFLGMLSSVLIGVPIGDLRHWGAGHLLWNRACRLFGAQWPKFSGYWALRKRVRRGGSIACGSDTKDDCFPALKHYLDTESFGCTAPKESDTYGEDLLRVHEASRKRSEARLRAEKATAAALLRRVKNCRHTSQNKRGHMQEDIAGLQAQVEDIVNAKH